MHSKPVIPRKGVTFPDKPIKVEFSHRKERELQSIVDSAKILYLIQHYLLSRAVHIKGYPETINARIRDIVDDEVIEISMPSSIKAEEDMTIYAILKNFVEIDLRLHRKIDKDIYHYAIVGSNIAKTNRSNIRFKTEKGDVFINNIVTSKTVIDATAFNIPTSVKVVLHQYKPQLDSLADEVKVSILSMDDPKHRLLQKTMKTYYVRDSQDAGAYEPLNEEFIDIRQYAGGDVKRAMKYYQAKGIRAEILVPIIYLSLEGVPVPLGVIHIVSYNECLELDKILETKEITFQIVDRIRAANTKIVKKRQDVLDIGRGGLRVSVSDPELISILPHQPGFSFSLYFKLQAPITLYGSIRNIANVSDKQILIGLDFQGRSSRGDDIRRLYNMLDPLEKEYKKKLTQLAKFKQQYKK